MQKYKTIKLVICLVSILSFLVICTAPLFGTRVVWKTEEYLEERFDNYTEDGYIKISLGIINNGENSFVQYPGEDYFVQYPGMFYTPMIEEEWYLAEEEGQNIFKTILFPQKSHFERGQNISIIMMVILMVLTPIIIFAAKIPTVIKSKSDEEFINQLPVQEILKLKTNRKRLKRIKRLIEIPSGFALAFLICVYADLNIFMAIIMCFFEDMYLPEFFFSVQQFAWMGILAVLFVFSIISKKIRNKEAEEILQIITGERQPETENTTPDISDTSSIEDSLNDLSKLL